MTLSEARNAASKLQHHVGNTIGHSRHKVILIAPCPTDKDERLIFLDRILTSNGNVDFALAGLVTKDFDVLAVFEPEIINSINSSWFTNFLPLA